MSDVIWLKEGLADDGLWVFQLILDMIGFIINRNSIVPLMLLPDSKLGTYSFRDRPVDLPEAGLSEDGG